MGIFKDLDIINDALAFLKGKKVLFFYLPSVIALVSGSFPFWGGNAFNIFDKVVEPIGIFSALLFSVIFIVVEHFLKRKDKLYYSKNEEDIQYLERYKKFTRNIVAVISFSIFIAGVVIILALVLPLIKISNSWWLAARNFVFCFFAIQYIVMILIVVKEMYAMLTDDIESKY